MARVLIVGDQPDEVLELVGHVLQQEGYAVKILDRSECNGNRIKGQGPDLLMLDESSPFLIPQESTGRFVASDASRDYPSSF
jgi:DNA-binding response OmpR family regulator